ncbi:hypothetical protein QBC32DRAFT_211678 [Pseudoneurospora amorphoporcata]|uniref:C2H2-type domain-containing protein n=1 Tax=Pseudoneurospora amorphoporcata TaxID=241081 RepID=A0AAN6NXK4_9PEZI|nr:hypothetical protein QBC32DRAFT_211678 [Pseudoneurospora amorphoporcata]
MDLWWRLLEHQSSDRSKQSKETGQSSAVEGHPAVVEPAHHHTVHTGHHNRLHAPATAPQLRAGLANLNTNHDHHIQRRIEARSNKKNSDTPVSTSAPALLHVPFVPATPLRTSLFSLASPCSPAYSTDSSPASLSLAYSDYDTEPMALSTPELLDTRRSQHRDNTPKVLATQKGDIVTDRSSYNSRQYAQRASSTGMMPNSTSSTNMDRPTRPPSLDVQLSRQQKRLSLLGRPSPAYSEATSARSSLVSPTQRNPPTPSSSSSRLLPGLGLPEHPQQRYTYQSSGGLRTSTISEDAPSGCELAYEISAAILKETEENATAEQPSTTLKIWGAVARCLEEITVSLGPPNPSAPAVSAPPSIACAPQLRATPSTRRMSNSVQSVGSRRTSYDVGARNDLQSRHRRVMSSSSIRSGRPDRGLEATYAMDEQGVKEYSCPFRVRNPVRFNIRDHEVCAMTSFESLADLRHHVMSYHRRCAMSHQCQRCKVGFPTQTALDEHLMLPKDEMCDTVPAGTPSNPEDGISEDVDRTLASGNGIQIWDDLWRLIFPMDDQVPSSDFHPVIELAEVEQQFDEGQEALKTHLQETLRLFIPEAIDDAYRNFLTGQLELVFEAHKANTIRKCLHRIHGSTNNDTTSGENVSSEDKRRRSSSGAGNVNLARRSTRRNRQSAIFQTSRAQDRQSSSSDGLFSPSLIPPWQSRRGSNTPSNISNNANKQPPRRVSDNTRSRPNLTGGNPPASPRRLSPHPTPTLSVSATVATNESDDGALKSPTTPASASGSAPFLGVVSSDNGIDTSSITHCTCASPSTCRCNELLAFGIHHNNHSHHFHGHPPARPKTAPIPSRKRMEELSVPKHRLRHQPALQVRTTGIDLNEGLEGRKAWTGDVRMYEDDDSDDEEEGLNKVFLRPKTGGSLDSAILKTDMRESYSPQSFKERLLSRGSNTSRGLEQLEEEGGAGGGEEPQGQSSEGTSCQRGSWMG